MSESIIPPQSVSGYVVRPFHDSDGPAVQSLFETDPGFFEMIQDAPPGPCEAQSFATCIPPGKDYDDKFAFCVFDRNEKLSAVIDMVRDYPKGVWFIGLLFLAPDARGKGLGKQLVTAIAAGVHRAGGTALRVLVQHANIRARNFWTREGFGFHSEHKTPDTGKMADVLERLL